MAVMIGSARFDENGKATGGQAGDQTGKEVSTQNWYLNTKGWVLLRACDDAAREKIARCMQAACDNKHIGYDQYERNSLYVASEPYGFDVTKVTKNVECDCSALVRVCCAYAGIKVASFYTSNQASILMKTGLFDKYTDDLHCKKSTNLLRGDILVTKTKGHTVVVLSDGANAAAERKNGKIALGDRLLKKGSGGSDVKELQEHLITLGYDVGSCGADGDFGSDTETAVRLFQSRNDLESDGEYGPKTHAALIEEIRKYETGIAGTVEIVSEYGGSVNIRMGNGTGFPLFCSVGAGVHYRYVATAANGWNAIVVDDRVGWVSGENSKIV